MKKFLFLSFAALCFAVTANAQNGNDNGQNGGGRRGGGYERMYQTLNLTPAQTAQFRAIDSTQRLKMQSIRSNGGSRDDMMAARKEGNDQKRALLTPDQQKKWDELQKQMQARMEQMRQQRAQGDNAGAPQSGGN